MKRLTATRNLKSALVVRVLASTPLILIGIQHMIGAAPLEPILRGAHIPLPEINAIVGPIVLVLGGILLLPGYFARLGALLALSSMAMATYSQLVFSWPDEPPLALPLILIVLAGYVLWKGAGAFSFDLKCTNECALQLPG